MFIRGLEKPGKHTYFTFRCSSPFWTVRPHTPTFGGTIGGIFGIRGAAPRKIPPMALTDTRVRNAKPQQKPYKLGDTDGLFLLITPASGKLWRLKYRFAGKEKSLALGKYPHVTLLT
jgi:hypothetical protein